MSSYLLTLLLLIFAAQASSARTEKILYIRGQFPDKKMGLTDSKWLKKIETIHKTLNDYWVLHSYGNISEIQPTYTPPLTLPKDSEAYFNYNDLASGMKAAAKKAGFPPKDHNHVVFLYPGIKHNISFGGLGGGGQIWLPGQNPFDGGLIHEFGHSLGLGHANSIEGEPDGESVYPGQRREGRDGLHMMGSDGHLRVGNFSTINLPMRHQLGFIDSKRIKTVRNDGTYRIFEYELKRLPSAGMIGLRLKVKDEDFWISYGYKMGKRWSNFPSKVFEKGVIVHRVKGSITDLLDFTPKSIGKTKNEEDYVDTRDGALTIGKSFLFPGTKISISPIAVGKSDEGLHYIDVKVSRKLEASDLRCREIQGAKGAAETNGDQVTITANSGPVQKKSESFAYYSCPLAGKDDTLSATLLSFEGGTSDSRVGIMIRSGEGGGSPHASILLQGDGALAMIWRTKNGTINNGTKIVLDPGQIQQLGLKLVRTEKTVTGSYTLDGTTWTEIKTVLLPFSSSQLKGLAVSSGDASTKITAKFGQVDLSPK